MRKNHLDMKRNLSAILAALMITSASYSQDIANQTITGVDVSITGPKSVSEARIRNFMSVKKGQKFSYDKLDDDVKSLYESGLVDDIEFLAEPSEGGVKIIAEVKTRPSLQAIDFEGNSVFSNDKLRGEAEVTAGSALNDSAILSGKRAIEDFYKEEGYPDVSVRHRIDKGQNGSSVLVYEIAEGVEGEIDEILFHGNDVFSGVELQREMDTKKKGIFHFFTKSGILDNSQLEQDKSKLIKFYQNQGYLRAKIYKLDRIQKDNGKLDLKFYIDEGAKYSVSGIGITGNTVYTYDELWKGLSLITGETFSADKLEDDIQNIRGFYGAKGYADVRINPEMVNSADNGVVINYRITEGERYRVGQVNIQGNNTTKDHVIRRELNHIPGDWFNSVDLDITEQRLRNLNYFSFARANSGSGSRSGYRDVNIQVQEQRTGSIGFGAGFSSIDNLVGFINIEQTNFDILDPWGFTGGGQRFNLNLRAGIETLDFSLSLTEPWFLGKRLSLGGELYYQDRQFISPAYDQRNLGGAIFIRKPLGKRSSIRAEYRLEQIEIELENDLEPGSLFEGEEGEFLRSAFNLTYLFDSRDSNVTPRRGHRVNLGATYTGGFLSGDVDTYTLNASGQKHILLPYDFILNFSGEVTVVDSFDGDDVPIFERTFLGGARNLRGFDFRDVGSVAGGTRDLLTDEVIGGNTSAFLTTELTFPLFNTIRGAVFGDVGFVNQDSYDFSTEDLHVDVGVGVRLRLPLGPFAIDYAIPVVSTDQEDDSGTFQFYLDYNF